MMFERLRDYLERRGPDDAALSAYGKLPQYGDFIRHRLSGRAAPAFKGWLDRGISRFWESDPEYSRHRIGAHALLLTFPDAGARVYGYLWGSHDAAGLRSFPFVIFLALRERAAGLTLPQLEILDRLTRCAEELRPRLETASDLGEIVTVLGQTRIALGRDLEAEQRQGLEQRLGQVTLGEFARSLYGADWQRRWADLVRYLRRRASGGDVPLSVRLPSSGRLSPASQVGFWAVFLQPILARSGTAVQLIHALDRDDEGIVLLRRELRHEDVHAFHPEMPGHELIEDLRQAVPAGRRRGQGEATPGSGSVPLASVLARGLVQP